VMPAFLFHKEIVPVSSRSVMVFPDQTYQPERWRALPGPAPSDQAATGPNSRHISLRRPADFFRASSQRWL
jgi:hypothetical protein